MEDRAGFFQAADGGTLLLDEVADLPLAMQVKLLRAIQERKVRKVGATVEEVVDVRIISATHQNLAECVEKGKFRQDLYYRLNVIELRLPALRERSDDIALLSDTILRKLAAPAAPPLVAPLALDALCAYHFPGNVRELENILERALAFANDGVIEVTDLGLKGGAAPQATAYVSPATLSAPPSALPPPMSVIRDATSAASDSADEGELPHSLPDYLDDVERAIIRRALGKTRYNRTQAAELLGISFRQLRYRMQRLSIHEPE